MSIRRYSWLNKRKIKGKIYEKVESIYNWELIECL